MGFRRGVVGLFVLTLAVPSYSDAWRTVPHTALSGEEHLSFVVKWGFVTGGYSTLSIQGIASVNGRPAYHIVSEARSVRCEERLKDSDLSLPCPCRSRCR